MDQMFVYTMVCFGKLVSAEKRIIIKIIIKIAHYYSMLESEIFKGYSKNIASKSDVLVGGLDQKISDEHNSIEVFDIALKYLVENVD